MVSLQSASVRKAIAYTLIALGLALMIGWMAGSGTPTTGSSRQEALTQYYSEQSVLSASTLEPKVLVGDNTDKAVLRIPAFGKDWVQPIVAGASQDVLDSGVLGRFPESTVPGGVGNYSITGHRVTHGEPFRYLVDLKQGNRIHLDSGGVRYTYTVTKTFVVDEHEVWVLRPVENRKVITLITCDSYTQHTTDRFVVRGVLTETNYLRK